MTHCPHNNPPDDVCRSHRRERRMCSIHGCQREAVALDMCDLHYRRWRRHGDPLYKDKDLKRLATKKRCSKCGEVKPTSEFYYAKRYTDKKYPSCKTCKNNVPRTRAHRKPKPNREKRALSNRLWRRNNPEKAREIYNRYGKKRLGTPEGKLNCNMSAAVRNCVHGIKKSRRWEGLVGYSFAQLKRHLGKQLLPGMTWENYGRNGWHVDHKIPKTAFNFKTSDDIDFKRCWALKNLRPMWEPDNIRKKDKLERPFQPSLPMAVAA
jgi:hypothetical protein